MFVQCNLNNVKEREVLPVGTYSVRIDTEPELVTDKGTPYMLVTLTMTDGEVPPENRKHMERVYASKTTGWENFRVKQLCEAASVEFGDAGFDTAEFIGREFKVALEQEVYNEKTRNNVKYFLKG